MDKDTVRKLRACRDVAAAEHREAEKTLQDSYPAVKRYLNTASEGRLAQRAYSVAWVELKQEQREELIPEFWPSAQLRLPKGESMPKRRDMSMKEFEAALKRRGFRDVEHGIKVSHSATIGPVMRWNEHQRTYEMDRRETLKRAIDEATKEKT